MPKIRDFFRKNPDGSWSPTQQVTITGPNGSKVELNPGASFSPGVQFMGLNIAALCEQDATI